MWLLLLLLLVLPAAAEEVIEVPLFEGAEGLEFFSRCARDYERLHPGVSVDLYGDPRISDKVRVRLLEGTFPELTNANLNYWALLKNGDLLALDPWLDQGWREQFLPGTLDRYTAGGKTYGIPFLNTIWAVWYNKKLFREKGWEPPSTWDEFFALCARMKAAGVVPVAFQGRYTFYAQPLIDHNYYNLAGPAAFLAQKNLEPGSFENPAMVEALRLVQETALKYFQPGALGMSHTEAQLEFFQGRAAMIFCGSWLQNEMKDNIPDGFELGVFRLPLPPGRWANPHALLVTTAQYFVFSRSRNPARAADFLRYMTGRAGEFALASGMPVAMRGTRSGIPDLDALAASATATFGEGQGEGYPAMQQRLADARFALLSGARKPEEIAQELERQASLLRASALEPDSVTVRHVWKPVALLCFLVLAPLLLLRLGPGVLARKRERWSSVLLFVLPAVGLYGVFIAMPSLASFGWALTRWDGLTPMQWVGLLNFRRLLFESDAFWTALGNNLFLMTMVPLFVLPLALFLAFCLSRGFTGAGFLRVAFFFPNLLGVGGVILWQQLYNPSAWGGFAWLSPDHLYWALIPMGVWAGCGFNMVLFLAAMESIPGDLYEAAELEGASEWQQFWGITLPLIWETVTVALVFQIIGGMKAFETIWLLTNQMPTTQTHVIGTLMVSTMFTEFRMGEATAIAVLLFAMVFVGTLVARQGLAREAVER